MTLALAGWLIGNPLGFGLAHAVVTLAENVFNEHVLFTFPLLNIPLALAGTSALALLVMLSVRRAVVFKPWKLFGTRDRRPPTSRHATQRKQNSPRLAV